MKHKGYSYFLASESDLLDLSRLMELSTRVLQKPFLNNQQIEASFEAMGLDTSGVDFDIIKKADWIVEAVVERIDIKHKLYEKILKLKKKNKII